MGREEPEPASVTARIDSSRRVYAALNAGDIDAVIALTSPDVDWANGLEGGRGRGHDAIRSAWERISRLFACRVVPLRTRVDALGRVVVDAEVGICDAAGKPLAHERVRHVFTFRGNLIRRLDVREPPPGADRYPVAGGRGGPHPPESGRDRRWDSSRQRRRRSSSSSGGPSPT
jgi:ketosteroid isomerase-like protein